MKKNLENLDKIKNFKVERWRLTKEFTIVNEQNEDKLRVET